MKIQENETLEIIEVYERERVPEFIQKGEPRYYEWKKFKWEYLQMGVVDRESEKVTRNINMM